MIYFGAGSEHTSLSDEDIRAGLFESFDRMGPVRKILVIPPDYSRYHSRSGEITSLIYSYFSDSVQHILPALGTHQPMSSEERSIMFPGVPGHLFKVHDWRRDIATLGSINGHQLRNISRGKVHYDWNVQVNKLLVEGNHDLILSVGQVVPHEVAGMANHNKNIFIGTGGPDSIHKSHYLGAVCNMESIMGRIHNPVRNLLNQAELLFSDQLPRIVYILTVIGKNDTGENVMRGLYVGDDQECFEHAAALSKRVNFEIFETPLSKVLVYLHPNEFKSTWLGNKAIYRTRMALADQAQLKILGPGIHTFGEDPIIDQLIRKYGYRGTDHTIEAVNANRELSESLATAAHLIHGSSEGRFQITYAPGKLSRKEIEDMGYSYESPETLMRNYRPENLKDGFNTLPDGEEIYYISNPALGLWTTNEKLK